MNDQPPEQEWLTATAEEEGVNVLFRLLPHIPLGIATSDFPDRIEILWPYQSLNESKLPGPQDREQMSQFEELLIHIWEESGLGHLTMLITGNELCHWQWYVRDQEQALESFNQALADLPDLPIQIHSESDPDWYSYSNFMQQVRKSNP